MATILIIEDEEILSLALARSLEKIGHLVHCADRCESGRRLFRELSPDLTLLDLRLPDGDGLALLQDLLAQNTAADVILMTAYASVQDAVAAIKLGARDYLQKPLNMDDVRHTIGRTLEEGRLRQEISYFRGREAKGTGIDELVGGCAALSELRARVQRLCTLPAEAAPPTVLLEGETGTGKGLVAHVLHYNGPRASQPFVEVNCAAIPETLIEAELFGHEKGAFTDAKASSPGLFRAADGGTLFLDEIGVLPPTAQAKLLKVIEEKTLRPVGGQSTRTVDVHVVAATNSDLEGMVRAGTFRDDLYYRLRVAVLRTPPLRERGDDLPLLAARFLNELCARYRLPEKCLSSAAQDEIRRYAWPGNIRELRNTLDRAVLFSEGTVIEASELGLPSAGADWMRWRVRDGIPEVELPAGGILFEELERAVLCAALAQAGGRQIDAAKLLGLSRDTMRYRVEKFGIDLPKRGAL